MSKIVDIPLRGQFVLEALLVRNKLDGANEAFTASLGGSVNHIVLVFVRQVQGRSFQDTDHTETVVVL